MRAGNRNRLPITLDPTNVAAFSKLPRDRLTIGNIPFRTAPLDSNINRVEVNGHKRRICGRKNVLGQAGMSNSAPVPEVRGFVRRWRARKESSLHPSDS